MKLSDEERKFLTALSVLEPPVLPNNLPIADRKQDKARQRCRKLGYCRRVGARDGYTIADRKQDKARQRCRKLGYCRRVGARDGYTKAGWAITEAGRAALNES